MGQQNHFYKICAGRTTLTGHLSQKNDEIIRKWPNSTILQKTGRHQIWRRAVAPYVMLLNTQVQ